MLDDLILNLFDQEGIRDEAWITKMAGLVMLNSNPIITKLEYEERANILFGKFPEVERNKLFQGKIMEAMKNKLSGNTVYFFEKTRNAIIDERTSAGLSITVNSLDPDKEEKKKSDRELLLNRKGIEAALEQITKNNGMPPMKITKDDFHGNVEDFDKEGLDDLDDDNVQDFFDSRWGLKKEMELGNILNAVTRVNQVSRKYDKYINDILITLHNFSQVYVDEIEGKIKIEHLYPYQVDILNPTGSNDYKDSQGFRVRKTTNIRGLLRRFGSSFNLQNNWQDLLSQVNSGRTSENRYLGISESGRVLFGDNQLNRCVDVHRLMDCNIEYSYIEFRVMNSNTKQCGVNANGNIVSIPYRNQSDRVDGWNTETKIKEDTYRAYVLGGIGELQPKVIKWGKLYLQPIEGVYDEYSGFSIIGNKRDGVPMVEILRPFHRMMQVAFTMFELLVNDVKPDGYIYNYDSMYKVAEHLQQATDTPKPIKDALNDLMLMFQNSPNMMTVTPTDEEDKIIGGDAFGVKKKENGLNKAANDLLKIIDWCEQKAEGYLGTQGIEFAEPSDGFKLSLENKRRTRAATQFIDFILLNHVEDQSITILSYALDIAKYKDIPAYKYLETLVGTKIMESIGSMKKSPHRHSLVLDTFNNDIQLLELRQYAQQDLQNGRLTLEQFAFVCKFDNINQAIYYLAQERKKADKKKQKDQLTLIQQQDAADQAKFERQLKLEDRKGLWLQKRSEAEAAGFSNAAAFNAKAAITKEQMQQDGQNKRLADSAINEIDLKQDDINKRSQMPAKV